ncbi:hypothetical protein KEJ39_02680 [Candidatus Bathyarchaeota archaeon]|nr:hypothetical protein [Candidatus Bathyarchaeota archaeon]
MSRDRGGCGQGEDGLLEMIDNLILHINEERTWFTVLVATSIIAAPISLLFTLYLLLHRRLVAFIFLRDPQLGVLAIMYFAVILAVSSLWLIVGLKEFKFISRWNSRFRRYFSLKERLDRELRGEFGEAG